MTIYYETLQNIDEEAVKCMKCGNCQEVCPIFKETLDETGVARGKIQLARALLDGTLDYTPRLQALFSLCLTCKACAEKCPCDVDPEKIILAARAVLAQKKGLHPLKRYIFNILKRPKLFKFGMSAGSTFQSLGLKKVKDKDLAHPRLPIGLDIRRVIRPLAKKSLLEELPERSKAETKPKHKVAFFTGCMLNYIYTDAGRAVVDVLTRNQTEVITPKDQHCCGIPAFIHGDMQTAKTIAKHNIDIFSKESYDALITHCGTCISSWSHYYAEILADTPEYLKRAQPLLENSYDVSHFLIEKSGIKKPQSQLDLKATYHDPCHMVRGLKVSSQPRQILKSIPGLELIEMKDANRCCGSAGTFSLTHYELSSRIRDKKTAAIKDTGADIVTTSCGACRMQIEDGLYQQGLDIPVVHVVQLLERAYQKEKKAAEKAV